MIKDLTSSGLVIGINIEKLSSIHDAKNNGRKGASTHSQHTVIVNKKKLTTGMHSC